jgi:hypothetical protein
MNAHNTNTLDPGQIESSTVTQPLLTPSAAVSQTASTSSAASGTTVYADPLGDGRRGSGLSKITNSAGDSSSKRVNLEKIKFRLVFILWPALIGISMAL